MARRDRMGTQDGPLLVSFFLPSSSSCMFNLLICIILKTKYISLNSSFHLPIFWCLLSTPKNIKVGPIIRIILVPPLSSVNLLRERSQRGLGWGGLSPLSQKPIPLEPPNEMKLSRGVYGEPPVWVPVSPRPRWRPSFWKGWLRPS